VILFAPPALAADAGGVAVPSSAPQFRSDNDDPARGKVLISALGSVFVVVAGAAVAYFGRRRFGSALRLDTASTIKILAVRRVTAKLTVVVLQSAAGEQFIVADNGTSLLRLSGSGTTPSDDAPSGRAS